MTIHLHRKIALLCGGLLLLCLHSLAQFKAINNNVGPELQKQGNAHSNLKISLVIIGNKGGSIGASYGMWQEKPWLQYSLNTGFMWRFNRSFLGNYNNGFKANDSRSRSQFVVMLSPMLTTRITKHDFYYQELEPFYYGTPNAVFSKFKNSFTLGSTFVISPRGTYKNVTTIRNRAQQVAMLSLNVSSFNFTMYDDFLSVFTSPLQLGDNWDRFFTGGGFVRYRFNREFTAHVYSEVYTGINRANSYLHPDLISYKNKGRKKWRLKNFANQDPGQEFFNTSWFIVKMSHTNFNPPTPQSGAYTPDLDFLVGTSASWTAFSQNFIHSLINSDTSNSLKLHYFLPRTQVPGNLENGSETILKAIGKGIFFGAAAHSNLIKN